MRLNRRCSTRDDFRDRLSRALINQHKSVFDSCGNLANEVATSTSCPSCSSAQRVPKFTKDGFNHFECTSCHLVYISPRLNDTATAEFYNSEANDIYNERKFKMESEGTDIDDRLNIELLEWLESVTGFLSSEKNILEIGPGRGALMHEAERRGWTASGVELNLENADELERSFPGRVYRNELSSLSLSPGSFSVIFLRDVIEHIPRPQDFLIKCFELLNSDGVICIATHNVEGLIHRIVGKRHSVIFGFEHPVHWSPRSLRSALSSIGFNDFQVRYGSEIPEYQFVVSDLSSSAILGYFMDPPFTYIFPGWPRSRFALRLAYKILNNRYVGLRNPWFFKLDANLWHRVAVRNETESYFAIAARK